MKFHPLSIAAFLYLIDTHKWCFFLFDLYQVYKIKALKWKWKSCVTSFDSAMPLSILTTFFPTWKLSSSCITSWKRRRKSHFYRLFSSRQALESKSQINLETKYYITIACVCLHVFFSFYHQRNYFFLFLIHSFAKTIEPMLIIRWIWLDKLDQILWIFSCVFEVYASVRALVCVFLSSPSFSYHSFLFSAFHTKNYYSLNWHQENLNTQVLKMLYKNIDTDQNYRSSRLPPP